MSPTADSVVAELRTILHDMDTPSIVGDDNAPTVFSIDILKWLKTTNIKDCNHLLTKVLEPLQRIVASLDDDKFNDIAMILRSVIENLYDHCDFYLEYLNNIRGIMTNDLVELRQLIDQFNIKSVNNGNRCRLFTKTKINEVIEMLERSNNTQQLLARLDQLEQSNNTQQLLARLDQLERLLTK